MFIQLCTCIILQMSVTQIPNVLTQTGPPSASRGNEEKILT